ncbi:MAG: ATP-dependent helicase HepA [Oleiphilaceae bacterium]|jgi:ATP-dependent helicase HepA
MAHAVIKEIRNEIGTLLTHAQAIAEKAVPGLIESAELAMKQQLGAEIQRLVTLQAKNSLIRDDEIDFLKEQKMLCQEYISKTGLEVQAMRIVINT